MVQTVGGVQEKIVASGADCSQIQAALDGLNGTRFERLKFLGEFNIDTILTIPDYPILDCYGAKFNLTANIARMFTNKNYGTTANQFMRVFGGEFNGNDATRTSGYAFDGEFYRATFRDIYVHDFKDGGCRFRSATADDPNRSKVAMINPYIYDNGGIGVLMTNALAAGVFDCEFLGGTYGKNTIAQIGGQGASAARILHTQIFSSSKSVNGIQILGGDPGRRWKIMGNEINVLRSAILMQPDAGGYHLSNIIKGNTFFNCGGGGDGVYVTVDLDGNTNNGYCQQNVITGNTFAAPDLAADHKALACIRTAKAGQDINNIIKDNCFKVDSFKAGNPAISEADLLNKVASNYGYITEKQGTSAIVSGQTHVHVTHDCAYTPRISEINILPTAKSTADPTFYVWVDGITDTEFVVNCAVDPGVLTLPFGWCVRRL